MTKRKEGRNEADNSISIHPPNASFNVSGELVAFCYSWQTYFSMHSIVHHHRPPLELHTCTCAGMVVSCMVCVQSYIICNSFYVSPRMYNVH